MRHFKFTLNFLVFFGLVLFFSAGISQTSFAQCVDTISTPSYEYATGRVLNPTSGSPSKYDNYISAGLTPTPSKGYAIFILSATGDITYNFNNVEIKTYTRFTSSSSAHILDYEEMTVDPYEATAYEIWNDIGANTEYTYSNSNGTDQGFHTEPLGSEAETYLQDTFNNTNGNLEFYLGFEEYEMDDDNCVIDGTDDEYPPQLIINYYKIPDTPTGLSASDGICDEVQLSWNSVSGAESYKIKRGATTIEDNYIGTSYIDNNNPPTSSETYEVYAKTDCGISQSSASDQGYALSSPGEPSIDGPSSACDGDDITFTASAPNTISYSWAAPSDWSPSSGSGSSFTTTVGSSGSVTVTPANVSCGEGPSVNQSVNIEQAPDQVSINGNIAVTEGDEETYEAVNTPNATSYNWSAPSDWSPNAGSGQAFTTTIGETSGNVSVLAENDCGSTSFDMYVNVTPTGFATLKSEKIKIFPNPANSIVNIVNAENDKIAIVNMVGQEIISTVASSKRETISISGLSNGVYIIRIKDDAEVITTKKLHVVK